MTKAAWLPALRLARVARPSDISLAEAMEAVGRGDFCEMIARNKVLRLTLANLSSFGDVADGTIVAAIEQLEQAERVAVNSAAISRASRAIGGWERRSGVRVVDIKGAAARHWYLESTPRDMSDLDVWVQGKADALALAHDLTGSGWRLSEASRSAEADIVGKGAGITGDGVIMLCRGDGFGVDIDVHYGELLAGSGLRATISAESAVQGGDSRWRSGDCDTIVTILLGVASRGWITGKDINDLYMARNLSGIDWSALFERLRRLALEDARVAVFRATDALYGEPGSVSSGSAKSFRGFSVAAPPGI